MKKLLKYTQFINEAFLQKDTEKAIDLILGYLLRKTGVNFYPYDEIWSVQKGPDFLKGQLFLGLDTDKALRFNWKKDDIRSEIHSIDIWLNFKFETNPDFTLLLNEFSIVKALPEIVEFFNNPKRYSMSTQEFKITEDSDIDDQLKQSLEDEKKKLSRLRNPEKIQQQKERVRKLEAIVAQRESSSISSQGVNQLDDELEIDVFKTIELFTIQVARGKSNSLIISGDAGIGKTQTVKDTLASIGMQKDIDYYFTTGTATTAALYELLFKRRNKLLVFDDCDSVLEDKESINILKGALDTYDVREISKMTKTNTFDSIGMTEEEMVEEFDRTGKLPNKFDFIGQIIFISNLRENQFDKAILSRSLHVDVHLNREQLFERMTTIMKRLAPDVEEHKKMEALEYLSFICENYPTKFDLNIRNLYHAINIRANNEGTMEVGGQSEKIWKLLIKKYLVNSRT